jgi:integrase
MAKRERGIREKHGRWEYRFMVAGRRHTMLTDFAATARNLPAAKRAMMEHRAKLMANTIVPGRPVRFSDAIGPFLHWSKMEHREHPNTAKRHAVSMASLTHFLGRQKVAEVTAGDLEAYKTWRRECGIKEVTIRHDLHAASQFFQYAVKARWAVSNPVKLVEMPSDRESRNEKVLSDAEEKAYFAEAARNKTLHDIGRLMVNQGMRPAEVLLLRKADVDLERRELLVMKSKSKAGSRTLNLTGESLVILGRRMASDGVWLFPGTQAAAPFTYSGLAGAHNRALKESGTSFGIYSLRHTFATRFYTKTKDLDALRRILGHADLKTVMRYVHQDADELRKAMQAYEESMTPLLGGLTQ